ncbi:hypothetical protein KDD93_06445 [Campylobacter sp. faydin G-24]|uniref:Disulfide bond formation protein, DsbB family n=1 Tax=Campylobacter anatolicus TaxID=2829105 RepID=A0ABS5HIV2_9BACT|nr:hypothetical protein [Campylobacter anatolicus]MBR8464199.1 hypothetical protein [Campylobacter anatolicus]
MKNLKSLICLMCVAGLSMAFEFDLNSNAGAIEGLTPLKAENSITLKLENANAITGADYDADKKQFVLVSKDNEFYVTDESFNPLRYGKHDRHFIMEMEASVGATWYKNEVAMISFNKTFVSYEPVDIIDKDEQNSQWRHLLAGWDKFRLNDFGNKNRFFTIRAKQQYILDFDYDAMSNKFIIASVPNDVRPSWSIGVFDGDDKMVLEEYIPSINANLKLKDGKDLSGYYITGIDLQGDVAYLLSKNFSTILELNLKEKQIANAYSFSGLSDSRAISVKDGKFYIFSREGKENRVSIFSK